MQTKVILTFDMEASIAGAFTDFDKNKPLIHEPVWGEVHGKSEALGFIIDTLQQHSLKATFFVETAHVHYFDEKIMGNYVKKLAAAKQDVQLHLHPCWTNFKKIPPKMITSDKCDDINPTLLVNLLKQGVDLIESWTQKKPIAMRTGNFASSLQVFEAMKEANLLLSSNICMGIYPPKEPEFRLMSGVKNIDGIFEFPSSSFLDKRFIGKNQLRPLQVTSCSTTEMIHYLNLFHENKAEYVVILSHPFEFLKKRNAQFQHMKPNRLVQNRFKTLCAYLADNQDKFKVTTFGHINPQELTEAPSISIEGSPLLSLSRSVQHLWNDRIAK